MMDWIDERQTTCVDKSGAESDYNYKSLGWKAVWEELPPLIGKEYLTYGFESGYRILEWASIPEEQPPLGVTGEYDWFVEDFMTDVSFWRELPQHPEYNPEHSYNIGKIK